MEDKIELEFYTGSIGKKLSGGSPAHKDYYTYKVDIVSLAIGNKMLQIGLDRNDNFKLIFSESGAGIKNEH